MVTELLDKVSAALATLRCGPIIRINKAGGIEPVPPPAFYNLSHFLN
jgi:hypothetical protein